jgi:hypothetical protein
MKGKRLLNDERDEAFSTLKGTLLLGDENHLGSANGPLSASLFQVGLTRDFCQHPLVHTLLPFTSNRAGPHQYSWLELATSQGSTRVLKYGLHVPISSAQLY